MFFFFTYSLNLVDYYLLTYKFFYLFFYKTERYGRFKYGLATPIQLASYTNTAS